MKDINQVGKWYSHALQYDSVVSIAELSSENQLFVCVDRPPGFAI